MATRQYTPNDLARFWAKVDISDNNACWVWIAHRTRGYGHFKHGGKYLLAHRVSWELANGPISSDLDILHLCDNPACVNPLHLKTGTHQDNMRDRNLKGRQARVRGEAHGCHKLTQADIDYIRERYAKGDISQKALGIEVGVRQSQIGRIVRGLNWK